MKYIFEGIGRNCFFSLTSLSLFQVRVEAEADMVEVSSQIVFTCYLYTIQKNEIDAPIAIKNSGCEEKPHKNYLKCSSIWKFYET